MKILFFTDTHLRGSTPQSRTDNFPESLIKKLSEVVAIAKQEEVDIVIHGGDLFDNPNPGLAQAGEYLSVLQQLPAPIYVVPGNHDIYGGNISTLPRTLLGFLCHLKYLNLLDRDHPLIIDENDIRILITGQGFNYDLEHDPDRSGYRVKRTGADLFVHVVHGMLLEEGNFPGEHTLIDDIADDAADLTLCGHYHLGFAALKKRDAWFVNPGALVRLTNHPREIARRPSVAVIDVGYNISPKIIELTTSLPGEEVLSREAIEEMMSRSRHMDMFANEIRAASDLKRHNIRKILEDLLAKESNIPEEVKAEAWKRLAKAEEIMLEEPGDVV